MQLCASDPAMSFWNLFWLCTVLCYMYIVHCTAGVFNFSNRSAKTKLSFLLASWHHGNASFLKIQKEIDKNKFFVLKSCYKTYFSDHLFGWILLLGEITFLKSVKQNSTIFFLTIMTYFKQNKFCSCILYNVHKGGSIFHNLKSQCVEVAKCKKTKLTIFNFFFIIFFCENP